MITVSIIIFVLVCLCILSVLNWRTGLIIIFIFMCVDGGIRRVIYDHLAIYLIKDFLLIFTYAGFLIEAKKLKKVILFRNSLNIVFLALCFLSLIQFFNPGLPNIIVGLVGLKLLLYYIPLFYLGYHFFDSKDKLISFIKLSLLIAIPIALIGVIQFIIGPAASLSISENFTPWITARTTGEIVYKPESTFAVPGIFGWYLYLMMLLAIANLNFKTKQQKLFGFLAFIFVSLGMIVNSSKGNVFLFFLIIICMLFLFNKLKMVIRLSVLVFLVFLVNLFLAPEASKNILDSASIIFLHQPPWTRAMLIIKYGLSFFAPFGSGRFSLLGNGVGISSLGTRYVVSQSEYLNFESFFMNILVQLGIFGVIIYFLIFGLLMVIGYKIYIKLKDDELKWISFVVLMFILGVFGYGFLSNILDHAIISIYFYFFSGIMFKLPGLDKVR